MSGGEDRSVTDFVHRAEKDRYALIIGPEDVPFAEAHLGEIYREYPCTGILVRLETGGTAYHMTPAGNLASILEHGLRPCSNPNATYGDGAIYAFPSTSCYNRTAPDEWALFELEYGPGCLQALATFDKEEKEQHELLIFPDKLAGYRHVPVTSQ